MPNFDAGTYFLTSLAPIKQGMTEDEGGRKVSYQQRLREELSRLPTALQSPATLGGPNSPFSRNTRNHLCRYVVIDDVVYNGRPPSTALGNALTQTDPINPEPVDRLNSAYLLFACDFDAVLEEGDPLPKEIDEARQERVRDAYAHRLWDTMEEELRRIYANCHGFDDVNSREDFAKYIKRTQVETTMPFHDYWIGSLEGLPKLPDKAIIAAIGLPLVAMLLGLLGWIFGSEGAWILGWLFGWKAKATFLWGLVLTVVAIAGAYFFVMNRGAKPLPPPEYGDLPTVMKSLYLQKHFSDLASDTQGAPDDELFESFGRFLETHKPSNNHGPTQAPGTISVSHDGAVVEGGKA